MGRGDKKTKKGKIAKGSYGNSRPRQESSGSAPEKKETKATEKKK